MALRRWRSSTLLSSRAAVVRWCLLVRWHLGELIERHGSGSVVAFGVLCVAFGYWQAVLHPELTDLKRRQAQSSAALAGMGPGPAPATGAPRARMTDAGPGSASVTRSTDSSGSLRRVLAILAQHGLTPTEAVYRVVRGTQETQKTPEKRQLHARRGSDARVQPRSGRPPRRASAARHSVGGERLLVDLPMTGTYPALRAALDALAAVPSLRVGVLRLARVEAGQTALTIRLQLSLLYPESR